MIKNSSFDFSYDYLRFDTTWLFEWNWEQITSDTVKFYPFTEQGTSRTWKFNNQGNTSILDHNEQIWDPTDPWLEYDADNPNGWDAGHPNNTTRYLAPGSSFITITNSIETVVIDNVPPAFVSDKGTEYVWICDKKTRADVKRHCEYVFRDDAGLDFRNFEVKIGNIVVYKYERLHEEDANFDPTKDWDTDPTTGEFYIDPESLKIASDGFHTYKVQFDLQFGTNDEEIEMLNEDGLAITVWDKAGNASTYTFGTNGSQERKWILIDTVDDISELLPLEIKFYDADPKNMVVDENQLGSVWCSIYNPNPDFWCIDIKAGLLGGLNKDENENENIHDFLLGADIDISTYDDSEYATTGVVRFKIVNIDRGGYLEVDGWLETGVKLFDDMLKTSTYAKEKCGPWIVMDSEGRKYNIQRYAPKYLRHTDFYEFVKFFELYLNTVYTNMTKGTNISILEKIAKIGDFNDIDRIENSMIWHYAKQFGMEFNIDLQSMLDLNLGFHYDSVIDSRTEDDVIDILKYALKNLPMYNQLKGSEKGMVFALKMFSLSCKVINLWCKLGPEVEENPDFIEEDRMIDFTSHFLTSRFNLEFNSLNCDFPTFNDNLEVFVRFIKSIKPIVRILNLIKYTIIFEYDLTWLMNPYVHDDFAEEGQDALDYTITWKNDEIDEMVERSRIDWKVMHADRIWIGFLPDSIDVEKSGTDNIDAEPANLSNAYTLLSTLLNESRHKFIFMMRAKYNIDYEVLFKDKYDEYGWYKPMDGNTPRYDKKDQEQHFEFAKEIKLTDIDIVMCDSGFYIYPKDGQMATHLAEFVKPAYFLQNYCADEAEKIRAAEIARIEASSETPEEKARDIAYVRNRLDIKVNITNPDTCSKLEMTTKIHHVPGTEICFCEPLTVEPLE